MTIDISCIEVLREISNYVDGEIGGELRATMQAHFKTCRHCCAILDGTRNVIRLVGDKQTFEIPVGFSKRLYTELDATFGK